MRLMMIVNQPDIARHIVQCGVDRIFVDLEYLGKKERQGHIDTWVSRHTPEDIARMREAIGDSELLVRLNPWHAGSAAEIDDAIARGANILMLPMYRSLAELEAFCRSVGERVPVIPLVETAEAMELLPQSARVPGVSELFIGLNDLHLSLGLRFMFEPLTNGILDRAAEQLHATGIPYGFGGLARVGEGQLPAEKIIGEHVRLGSTAAILSRTFHRQAKDLAALNAEMDFAVEVRRLRDAFSHYQTASEAALATNHAEVARIIDGIVGNSTAERGAPLIGR